MLLFSGKRLRDCYGPDDTMIRKQAECLVRTVMYGAPGEVRDTRTGRVLMVHLLTEMGLDALNDEAMARLHQQQDAIEAGQVKLRSFR